MTSSVTGRVVGDSELGALLGDTGVTTDLVVDNSAVEVSKGMGVEVPGKGLTLVEGM